MVCEVGEPDPDIAGIGILLAFSAQSVLSLCLSFWVFFLSRHGKFKVEHEEGTREHKIEVGRLKIISKVLTTGNDVQMLQGIALLVTGLVGARTMSLYHLRLVYETASLVGPSSAAAVAAWTFVAARVSRHQSHTKRNERVSLLSPRHRVIYIFIASFLALTIVLGVRLNGWNEEEEGHCYVTDLLMAKDSSHPAADKAYIAVTSAWLIISMALVIFGKASQVRPTLLLALLQFPVHFYLMVVLRIKNSNAITKGEDEDGWRFGQTIAVALLGVTLNEAIMGVFGYWRWEKKVEKEGKRMNTFDVEQLTASRME